MTAKIQFHNMLQASPFHQINVEECQTLADTTHQIPGHTSEALKNLAQSSPHAIPQGWELTKQKVAGLTVMQFSENSRWKSLVLNANTHSLDENSVFCQDVVNNTQQHSEIKKFVDEQFEKNAGLALPFYLPPKALLEADVFLQKVEKFSTAINTLLNVQPFNSKLYNATYDKYRNFAITKFGKFLNTFRKGEKIGVPGFNNAEKKLSFHRDDSAETYIITTVGPTTRFFSSERSATQAPAEIYEKNFSSTKNWLAANKLYAAPCGFMLAFRTQNNYMPHSSPLTANQQGKPVIQRRTQTIFSSNSLLK